MLQRGFTSLLIKYSGLLQDLKVVVEITLIKHKDQKGLKNVWWSLRLFSSLLTGEHVSQVALHYKI